MKQGQSLELSCTMSKKVRPRTDSLDVGTKTYNLGRGVCPNLSHRSRSPGQTLNHYITGYASSRIFTIKFLPGTLNFSVFTIKNQILSSDTLLMLSFFSLISLNDEICRVRGPGCSGISGKSRRQWSNCFYSNSDEKKQRRL